VLYSILQQWGYEGFDGHIDRVSDFYRQKRDQCIQAATTHLTGEAFTHSSQLNIIFNSLLETSTKISDVLIEDFPKQANV